MRIRPGMSPRAWKLVPYPPRRVAPGGIANREGRRGHPACGQERVRIRSSLGRAAFPIEAVVHIWIESPHT